MRGGVYTVGPHCVQAVGVYVLHVGTGRTGDPDTWHPVSTKLALVALAQAEAPIRLGRTVTPIRGKSRIVRFSG